MWEKEVLRPLMVVGVKMTVVVGVSCNKYLMILVAPLSANSVDSAASTSCGLPKGPNEVDTWLSSNVSRLGVADSKFLYSVIFPFTIGTVTSVGI